LRHAGVRQGKLNGTSDRYSREVKSLQASSAQLGAAAFIDGTLAALTAAAVSVNTVPIHEGPPTQRIAST